MIKYLSKMQPSKFQISFQLTNKKFAQILSLYYVIFTFHRTCISIFIYHQLMNGKFCCKMFPYINSVYKYLIRQIWAISIDQDQTSPEGASWSGSTLFANFSLHHLDTLFYGKTTLLKFWDNYSICFRFPFFLWFIPTHEQSAAPPIVEFCQNFLQELWDLFFLFLIWQEWIFKLKINSKPALKKRL